MLDHATSDEKTLLQDYLRDVVTFDCLLNPVVLPINYSSGDERVGCKLLNKSTADRLKEQGETQFCGKLIDWERPMPIIKALKKLLDDFFSKLRVRRDNGLAAPTQGYPSMCISIINHKDPVVLSNGKIVSLERAREIRQEKPVSPEGEVVESWHSPVIINLRDLMEFNKEQNMAKPSYSPSTKKNGVQNNENSALAYNPSSMYTSPTNTALATRGKFQSGSHSSSSKKNR